MVAGIARSFGPSLSLLSGSGGAGLQYAFQALHVANQPDQGAHLAMAAHALAIMTAGQYTNPPAEGVHGFFRKYLDVRGQGSDASEAVSDGGDLAKNRRDARRAGAIEMMIENFDSDFVFVIDGILEVFFGGSFSGMEDVAEWNNPEDAYSSRSDWEEIASRATKWSAVVHDIEDLIRNIPTGGSNLFREDDLPEIQELVHLLRDVFALSPMHPLSQIKALRARIEKARMHGSLSLNAAVKLWEQVLKQHGWTLQADGTEFDPATREAYIQHRNAKILGRHANLRGVLENIENRIKELQRSTQKFSQDDWNEITRFVHLIQTSLATHSMHPLGQIGTLRARLEDSDLPESQVRLMAAALELWEGALVHDLMLKAVGYLASHPTSSDKAQQQVLSSINETLTNPDFQRDPVAYIKGLRAERGRLHHFRFPIDIVLPFLEEMFLEKAQPEPRVDLPIPAPVRPNTPPPKDEDELISRAQQFLNEKWDHMQEFHEQIVSYIVDVWRKPAFQSNPKSYITQWNNERGALEGLEGLRPPGEDQALAFYKMIYGLR